MQDILSGLPSGRHAKIETRTKALRQALIEGEESCGNSPLGMEEIRREA